jgi:hypothetical protein
MRQADAVSDAVEAGAQLARDLIARADHRDRLEHFVADQARHVVPAVLFREAIELEVQVAPAVAVECAAIGGGRAVEGELLACRELDPFEIVFTVRGDGERGGDDVEAAARFGGAGQPLLDAGQDDLQERFRELNG